MSIFLKIFLKHDNRLQFPRLMPLAPETRPYDMVGQCPATRAARWAAPTVETQDSKP